MFSTYARVCNDESDEEEAAAARLIRETVGGAQPPVAPNVVSSTGAARSRTQQDVQQRRGGGRAEPITVAEPAPIASTSTSVGDLIDFGDEADPRPRSAASAMGKAVKQRGRAQPAPNQVELVAMAPSDPFDLLLQQSTTQRPPRPPGAAAASSHEQQQQQHPLDLLVGQDAAFQQQQQAGRDAAHFAASTSGAGTGAAGRPAGPFPAFGSFSDLIRPLAGSFGAGPSASASSAAWGSFNAAPPGGAGAGPGGAEGAEAGPHLQRHAHSQSTNGIDDLLMQQRVLREGEAGAASVPAGPGAHYKPPTVVQTSRGEVFDPFGHTAPAAPAGSAPSSSSAAQGADGAAPARSDASFDIGGGGGAGYNMNNRELLLYAVPLFKDRLVFLPVVNWKDAEDTSTVLGKVNAGVAHVQQNISHMWHSLKDKGEFSSKIYKAGQAILENMNAEERLMRNIPRKANKLVVHHPAGIPPDEVQDQLTQLTSSFCYKSAGKAAVAGVMLPVAVGLEVIAVPGIGWYTAYQLFKSTSAAAGGSRLNNYLKSEKSEVRVCYVPTTKMDLYVLKARLSPDGVLGSEDVEDLCHDIKEPALLHPLIELRNRQLKKTQTTKADYALLPMSAPDVDEQYGSGPKKKD